MEPLRRLWRSRTTQGRLPWEARILTCIVGLVGPNGVLIAGDAQFSTLHTQRMDSGSKVFSIFDTVVAGYCGSGRFGEILEYHLDGLEEPPIQMDERRWVIRELIPFLRDVLSAHGHLHIMEEDQTEHFGESEFLLGVRGRLFCIASDFSTSEHVHPYEATGSGADVASGVLHAALPFKRDLLSIAEKAIAAATELTPFVGGDVTSVTTVRYTADEKDLARAILRPQTT